MKLTKFAKYCKDRNIGCLIRGTDESTHTVFVDVYGVRGVRPVSDKKRQNFEQRLREDNLGWNVDILYL